MSVCVPKGVANHTSPPPYDSVFFNGEVNRFDPESCAPPPSGMMVKDRQTTKHTGRHDTQNRETLTAKKAETKAEPPLQLRVRPWTPV